MVAALEFPPINTIADLLDRLGGIPAERVRLRPPPGDATEQDAIDAERRFGVLCELIDGTLVEKAMGLYESILAGILVAMLNNFVLPRRLGVVATPDGMYRVRPGQIRLPDVSFISRKRLPAGYQNQPAPSLAPDLAVEILSKSNTPREIARKRSEFFTAGTSLMWVIEPRDRTVAVYTDLDSEPVILSENQTVDGGDVLPGFSFVIRELFAATDQAQD